MRPGDSATLAWNVVAGKPNPGTYQICIDISASNFPGARCCIPLIVQTNEAVPVIACSLGGPDTVRYVNGAYEPNPIVLHVGAQNLGASPAKNVYAALLQGADLSIDGTDQALKIMSDSLAGGHDTTTTFRVRVLDRLKARFDTIRVSVYAANGGAVVCEKIVWIEAVTGPAMELTCAGPDSLAFSELLDEYVPNPYTFTITAKNVGTAPADSVLAEFLLPPDVTLAGGEQAAKLLTPSTLGVGQSGTASWRVVSVLRDTPRIDTLRAQVRSRGRTVAVTQPCLLPVRVPARRVADLDISCAPVGNIRVIAGKYDPDPFLVRLTLTNRGNAEVFDISARVLSMGSRIALADSGIKLRPALGPRGGQTVLEWRFLATPRATGDSVEICFLVGALRQNTLLCCTKVWLPPLPPAGIEVLCSSVDTVRYDVNLGRYPSPIPVTTTVTNTSQVPVDTVRATLILPPGLQLASGETSDKRIVNILPQQPVQFGWQMDVVLDTSTVAKARTVRIQYFAAGGLTTCDVTIIVLPPPQGRDSTGFELHCSSPDTIHYVNPQVGLQPSPFIVRADIRNTGTTPLDGISATLQLPAGVMLGSGENVTKPLGSALGPGQTATITWSCIPGVSEVPITGVIEIRVNATGLTSQLCATRIYIERVYRVVQLLIPRGNVVRTGELILVPAIFTNPSLAVVTAFRFGVRYDPATVRVEGINVASSLTQGWTVTGAEVAPGHFLFTGSSTVPLNGSGTVVGLVIRALSGDGSSNVFGWKLSDLTLDSVSFPAGVDVELQHGDIVTSAECLLPLKGTSRFVLRPNHPNPFRHSTTISYALAPGTEPATVQIDIYDPFGRLVRRFEEGVRSPGDHSVTWDATGLPEGVYYCHLVADGRAQVRAMIMAR
ncbi:MAG: hypothetical protein IPP94_19550 [Ignavibacteria bacterium]|nr:hypothetical protein [Ignavibacteria bacterium]